jgi:hypothetical protein
MAWLSGPFPQSAHTQHALALPQKYPMKVGIADYDRTPQSRTKSKHTLLQQRRGLKAKVN